MSILEQSHRAYFCRTVGLHGNSVKFGRLREYYFDILKSSPNLIMQQNILAGNLLGELTMLSKPLKS